MTEVYVVVKLTSGEQIMSVLTSEDENFIQLTNPLLIRGIPSIAEGREHLTAAPLCQFTDDNEYLIDKKNVLFIKNLAKPFIATYKRLTEEEKPEFVENTAEEEIDDRVYIQGNDTIN
jgi:hypothetical protein